MVSAVGRRARRAAALSVNRGVNETSALRLFIAIPIPAEVKAALLRVQQELRGKLPSGLASWTKPENMHLTLRFLGDVGPERVQDLQRSLSAAVAGFGELQLSCERLGCFPESGLPRVVWSWVHDADERLNQLAVRINQCVDSHAEKPAESRFVGHITIARLRQLRRAEAEPIASFLKGAEHRSFGTWPAGRAELIRSELCPGGSRYTTLATFDLAGNNSS